MGTPYRGPGGDGNPEGQYGKVQEWGCDPGTYMNRPPHPRAEAKYPYEGQTGYGGTPRGNGNAYGTGATNPKREARGTSWSTHRSSHEPTYGGSLSNPQGHRKDSHHGVGEEDLIAPVRTPGGTMFKGREPSCHIMKHQGVDMGNGSKIKLQGTPDPGMAQGRGILSPKGLGVVQLPKG